MSSKGNNIQYVKHVPDFLARMGLTHVQVQEHEAKHVEAKLEDKFKHDDEEERKEEYDFEHAQIDDLANMLAGGPLKEGPTADQDKL